MRIGMRINLPQIRNNTLHYHNGDLAHALETLARLGYDSVEFDLKHPGAEFGAIPMIGLVRFGPEGLDDLDNCFASLAMTEPNEWCARLGISGDG